MFKKVNTDIREVTVYKLPLGKYSQLFKKLNVVFKHLKDADSIDTSAFFERLPIILSDATPDVIDILVITTDLKKEEAEQLGLAEATRIFKALFEINSYDEVFDNLKKMFAQRTLKEKSAKR